jgi:hypothetical protein
MFRVGSRRWLDRKPEKRKVGSSILPLTTIMTAARTLADLRKVTSGRQKW